jgi:hypothetical protein
MPLSSIERLVPGLKWRCNLSDRAWIARYRTATWCFPQRGKTLATAVLPSPITGWRPLPKNLPSIPWRG